MDNAKLRAIIQKTSGSNSSSNSSRLGMRGKQDSLAH